MTSKKEYYQVKNYRAIHIKFLGATNHNGARTQIWEEDCEGKKIRKTFSYDYECSDIGEQAYKILIKNGFKVVCKSCLHAEDIILCDNWGKDFKYIKDIKD